MRKISSVFDFHSIDDTSSVVHSIYSSEATANSQTHSRNCQMLTYGEVIQVNVVDSGCYIFGSNSRVNTFGSIYKNNFDPSNPSKNLFSYDQDGSGGGGQFRFASYLQANTKYKLVVTTSSANVTEKFSIVVSGLHNVTLDRTSECLHYLLNNQHRNTN
jgi:hypothetical protein